MSEGAQRPEAWTLEEAESWILSLEQFGISFGLERISALLAQLGSPEKRGPAVHVVGSNGKSSVTRMIAAIVGAHGLSTGAYLSPHFVSFTERILIDGAPCADGAFASAARRVCAAAADLQTRDPSGGSVTQFEALTAAAFLVFDQAAVQVSVVEAGLGGRLDASNVIDSAVQVLTSTSLEHTELLGSTLAEIAREKLDVVRPGGTLVVANDLDHEVLAVAAARCEEQGARLVVAGSDAPAELAVGGRFQRRNFALAAAAAHALLGSLDAAAVSQAAREVTVPGRYQLVSSDPTTIFDGAHNAEGARALAASVAADSAGREVTGCVSVLADKDAEAVIRELAACSDSLVFTRCTNPRALAPSQLAAICRSVGGPPSVVVDAPHAALEDARRSAGSGGFVFAAGSLYLIADLMRAPNSKGGSTL